MTLNHFCISLPKNIVNVLHKSMKAPEFINEGEQWLNSEPLTLADLKGKLKFTADEAIIKPGSMILSGRGVAHLEGAARALAALRYRDYLTFADVQKVLLPVIRHRTHFTPNALSTLTRNEVRGELVEEFKRSGKTEMSEYLLKEIIRVAWSHASVSRKKGA